MTTSTRNHLTSGATWTRALYMLLFALAYGIAELIVTVTVLFQFFTVLFTGRANEPLLRFGNATATYIRQILAFQTFNTETRPFPFDEWPDVGYGGEAWLEEWPEDSYEAEPYERGGADTDPVGDVGTDTPPQPDMPPVAAKDRGADATNADDREEDDPNRPA